MQQDRRYHPRRDVTCRVDYADARGDAGLGLIRNLSINGLFVAYVSGLSVGETIITAFAMPHGPSLKLKARVMRVTPDGVGLRFVGLPTRQGKPYPDTLEMYRTVLHRLA